MNKKLHILALTLIGALSSYGWAQVAVSVPANIPLVATLTPAQVAQFTGLVIGIPAGKSIQVITVFVQPDGTGRLTVNAK